MDYEIAQIGEVTTNGNNIVKMQRKIETETALGTMRKSETYYMAIKAGSAKVKVGDKVNINPADFVITERPYTLEEGDNAGETIMLKWLSLK